MLPITRKGATGWFQASRRLMPLEAAAAGGAGGGGGFSGWPFAGGSGAGGASARAGARPVAASARPRTRTPAARRASGGAAVRNTARFDISRRVAPFAPRGERKARASVDGARAVPSAGEHGEHQRGQRGDRAHVIPRRPLGQVAPPARL